MLLDDYQQKVVFCRNKKKEEKKGNSTAVQQHGQVTENYVNNTNAPSGHSPGATKILCFFVCIRRKQMSF